MADLNVNSIGPASGSTVTITHPSYTGIPWYDVTDPAYGATGNGSTDDATAIQTAINAAKSGAGGVIYFPPGIYKVATPLNLANLGSTQIVLCGPTHGEGTYNTTPTKGASIYGLTGTQAVIEAQGSHMVTIRDLQIFSMLADTNRSAIGVFIGRTTFQNSAQFHSWQRVFVSMANKTGANGGKGSIALYNVQGEHGQFEHCQFYADLPLCLYDRNDLGYTPTNGTLTSVTSCALNEFRTCAFVSLSQYAIELRGVLSTTFLDCYYGAFSKLPVAVLLQAGANIPSQIHFMGGQCETYDAFFQSAVLEAHDIDINITFAQSGATGPLIQMNVQNNQIIYGLSARLWNTAGTAMQLVGVGAAAGCKIVGDALVLANNLSLSASTLTVNGATIRDDNVSPATVSLATGSNYQLIRQNGTVLMFGAQIAGGVAALSYAATVATDASRGINFTLTVTNTTAFTIQNPTNLVAGASFNYDILNSSGGVMGAVTWDTNFKLAGAFVNPASTKRRTIQFYSPDGTVLVEQSRCAADI